jgi:hypothetical protein
MVYNLKIEVMYHIDPSSSSSICIWHSSQAFQMLVAST